LASNKNGYLIVCSTFEAKQCGSFTLEIETTPEKIDTLVGDYTNALEISRVDDTELQDEDEKPVE
jgi:hypothetical protein